MSSHEDMYDEEKQSVMDDVSTMQFAHHGRPIRNRQNCDSKMARVAISVVYAQACSQPENGSRRKFEICLGQQKVRRVLSARLFSSQKWRSLIETRDALLRGRSQGSSPGQDLDVRLPSVKRNLLL